jgi:symplekin
LSICSSSASHVASLAASSPSPAVRLHAAKALELIVALYTAGRESGLHQANTTDSYPCDDFDPHDSSVSLHICAKQLNDDALSLLDTLTFLAQPRSFESLPAPLLISLINGLATLTRCRTQLVHKALPPLLQLAKSTAESSCHRADVSFSSIRHSLLQSLLAVLRVPIEGIVTRRDVICNALEELGIEDDAESAIKQADRLKNKQAGMKIEEPVSETGSLTVEVHGEPDASKPTVPPPPPPRPPQQQQQAKQQQQQQQQPPPPPPIASAPSQSTNGQPSPAGIFMQQLYADASRLGRTYDASTLDSILKRHSQQTLVDFILHNILHMSGDPPPASATGAGARLSGSASGKRKRGGKQGSTGKPLTAMLQDAMHSNGASAYIHRPQPASSASSTSQQQSRQQQQHQQQQQMIAAAARRKKVKVETVRPGKAVQPLSQDGLRSLRSSSMQRISRTAPRGSWQLRSIFLSRLASGCNGDTRADAERIMINAIFDDFHNAHGFSLALQWLFSVFASAESDEEGYYERIFSKISEQLQNRTTARDRSLMRLMVEAPFLPESAFEQMRRIVELNSSHTGDTIGPNGEQQQQQNGAVNEDASQQGQQQHSRSELISLGLSTIRDVILHRPGARQRCVQMLCEASVHPWEEARSKAVRLVASKIIGQDHLGSRSVVTYADSSLQQAAVSESRDECNRLLALVGVVCKEKVERVSRMFEVYTSKKTTEVAREAIATTLGKVAQAVGPTEALMDVVSAFPNGSEQLTAECVRVLYEHYDSSRSELHRWSCGLADSRNCVELLVPTLAHCSKQEALELLQRLILLKQERFRAAVHKLCTDGGPLHPTELLVELHHLEQKQHHAGGSESMYTVHDIIEACNACFQMRSVFTPEVLSAAINQLAELSPLPVLFMRTMMQALAVAPKLQAFLLEVAQRLVGRQVWKEDSKLWSGFLLFMAKTLPDSCSVLLALPPEQLQSALKSEKHSKLGRHLQHHLQHNPLACERVPSATLAVINAITEADDVGAQNGR